MDKEIIHKDFGDVEGDLAIKEGKLIGSIEIDLKPIVDKILEPIIAAIKKIVPGEGGLEASFVDGIRSAAYGALGLEEKKEEV